jgi:DNA repair protein RadC
MLQLVAMKYLKKLDIKLIKGEYKNPVKGQVREPEQVYDIFQSIKDKAQETLIGVYLDKDLEVRAYDVLSTGGEEETLILPHEIFRHAIVLSSRIFILIHNHPKGDPTPSADDKKVIAELKIGAKSVKLNFLDFIIVGDNKYWSMFEEADGGEYALGSIY